MLLRPRIALAFVLFFLTTIPAICQLYRPIPPRLYSPFSRIQGYVETGWYASSEVYKYVADVNLSFDFGSWNQARFNFYGGILTLIDSNSVEGFQPDRYRGTLQPSAYIRNGLSVYSFAVRHQSYHNIDQPLGDAQESYELYNLGYQWLGRPYIAFFTGKYLNRSNVDYDWDFFLNVSTACIGRCRYSPFYVAGTGHFVIENGSLYSRSSFFDYELEAGYQNRSGVRYFTSYRLIHDVDKPNGITDHQWIFGIKYIW
jgi:hypothetical protein